MPSETLSPPTEPVRIERPRALFEGARMALVAPAGPLDAERLEASADRCRQFGLEPVVFPSASAKSGFLAGSDEARLSDLQGAFDDPSIDGVWALRGGYGTIRIVDRLTLERQRRDPIPFIGFSDNTTIHIEHAASHVVSFHGPHPGGDFPPETKEHFRRVLFSEDAPGPLTQRTGDPRPRTPVDGAASGALWGGNLATLASLCGSQRGISAADRILVLEDVGEPAYRVDRMLLQLERAGVLDGVSGLALGRFTAVPGGKNEALQAVLTEFAIRVGVPAVINLPFGHMEHNCTLPLGTVARLDATAGTLEIVEGAVVEQGPGPR